MERKILHHHSVPVSRTSKVFVLGHHRSHQTQLLQYFPTEFVPSNHVNYANHIRVFKNRIIPIGDQLSDDNNTDSSLETSSISSVSDHCNERIVFNRNHSPVKMLKNQIQPVHPYQNYEHYESIKQFSNNPSRDDCFNDDLQKRNSCLASISNQVSVQQEVGSSRTTHISNESLKTKTIDQHFSIAYTDSNEGSSGTNIVNKNQKELSQLPEKNSTNKINLNLKNRRKKKHFGSNCCQCSPVCIYLSIIAALLVAIAIAALLIALSKSKTTSTTITTTTSTSTTTTSTSTTTTSTSTTTTSTSTTTTSTSTTSTSTTTTSTSTTSTTSTTTTTARPLRLITQPGDYIVGLYNTTAGGSTGGLNGIYSGPTEQPPEAIDSSLSTKYLNYGSNRSGLVNVPQPGINTGFYVTPNISNSSIACGLLFGIGNDSPERDPLTVTLEGTNSTALDSSSSWTLIYNGPTGIDSLTIPNRSTYATLQNFSNTIAYRSYRLLVTLQRGNDNSVQYAESQIWGYY